jgi:hypothetical protein
LQRSPLLTLRHTSQCRSATEPASRLPPAHRYDSVSRPGSRSRLRQRWNRSQRSPANPAHRLRNCPRLFQSGPHSVSRGFLKHRQSKLGHNLLARNALGFCHGAQDRVQRADSQLIMNRYRDAVSNRRIGLKNNMAADLVDLPIAPMLNKRLSQIAPAQIAR